VVRKSSDLQAAKYRFAKKRPDLERSNPVGDATIGGKFTAPAGNRSSAIVPLKA